ncbi:MAG: hypothetical protein R3B91_11850 [Planctomycetaceae bacterium]
MADWITDIEHTEQVRSSHESSSIVSGNITLVKDSYEQSTTSACEVKSDASRIARMAGQRFGRARLATQTPAPADRVERDLSAGIGIR